MPPTMAAAERPAVMKAGTRVVRSRASNIEVSPCGAAMAASVPLPLIANRIPLAAPAATPAPISVQPSQRCFFWLWRCGGGFDERDGSGDRLRRHRGHRGRREVGVQGRDAVEQRVGGVLDVVDHLLGRADVALGDGVVFAVAGDVPDPQLDVVAAHVVAAAGGDQHVTRARAHRGDLQAFAIGARAGLGGQVVAVFGDRVVQCRAQLRADVGQAVRQIDSVHHHHPRPRRLARRRETRGRHEGRREGRCAEHPKAPHRDHVWP